MKVSERGDELVEILKETFLLNNKHINTNGDEAIEELQAWNGAFLLMTAKTFAPIYTEHNKKVILTVFEMAIEEARQEYVSRQKENL